MAVDVSDSRHLSIYQMEENITLHLSNFGLALAPRRGMLKISIKDSQTRRLLVLEGKIIAPWTNELNKVACQDLANHSAGRELVIDFRGVTDISADGEEALYCLLVQGAKFRGGGVFIKQVLKQLARRVRRNDSL